MAHKVLDSLKTTHKTTHMDGLRNFKAKKKAGRPKNYTNLELGNMTDRAVYMMTYGVEEVTNKRNIEKGVKPGPMYVDDAFYEVGFQSGYKTFLHYAKKYPELKQQYQALREQRKEVLKEMAEDNINQAISGDMKDITNKDKVDYSFRLLEKTDPNYNPKTVIEQETTINPHRTKEDILADIQDLT